MYLLNEFARTVGAKDKKDRKRKGLQIAGGIAGAALLGGLAIKNKGKLGQLFKKKPLTNIAKETPKPMLALPAAGQSSSPINKVKNELSSMFDDIPKKARRTNPSRDLDNLDNLSNRVLVTPSKMTKKEFNTGKVAARKQALDKEINSMNYDRRSVKQGIEDIADSKILAKNRTDMPLKTRARIVKDSKRELRRDKASLNSTKKATKDKVNQLRKSNPSLYHLNKLIEFSLCTY